MRIVTSHPPIRWIYGRRCDDDDPGGRVVATVHAPQHQSEWDFAADIRCPYIYSYGDLRIYGVDAAQSVEEAIRMVLSLYEHRGVRDVTISLVPLDDPTC